MMASHRMPLDWTACHAGAGALWLVVAIAAACTLTVAGAESPIGARVAAAYGAAGLLGWMSTRIRRAQAAR